MRKRTVKQETCNRVRELTNKLPILPLEGFTCLLHSMFLTAHNLSDKNIDSSDGEVESRVVFRSGRMGEAPSIFVTRRQMNDRILADAAYQFYPTTNVIHDTEMFDMCTKEPLCMYLSPNCRIYSKTQIHTPSLA